MYNIVVPSLEEDMALIGLTDKDVGRTDELTEDAGEVEFDDNDVEEAFGSDDNGDRNILSRVRETLGALIESVQEEDSEDLAESYQLVSEIAVSLAEAFAQMEDDGVLSEETADGEEVVESLTDLAGACLEMCESLEGGMDADADVYEQLAENIEAVLGGIELFEGLLAEVNGSPFDEEYDDDEDE